MYTRVYLTPIAVMSEVPKAASSATHAGIVKSYENTETHDGFLNKWFNQHLEGKVIFKNTYYFHVYEKYFKSYIKKDLVLLEIGVMAFWINGLINT